MKQRMSNKSGSVIINHRWLVADLKTVCSSCSSGSLHQRLSRHQSANQTTFMPAGASLTNCFRFQRNVSTSSVFFFFFLVFQLSTEGKGRSNEAVEAWSESRWQVGWFYSSSWATPRYDQALTSEIGQCAVLKGHLDFYLFIYFSFAAKFSCLPLQLGIDKWEKRGKKDQLRCFYFFARAGQGLLNKGRLTGGVFQLGKYIWPHSKWLYAAGASPAARRNISDGIRNKIALYENALFISTSFSRNVGGKF